MNRSRTRERVAGATLGQWLGRAERRLARSGAALGQIATNPHDEALALVLQGLRLPLDSGPEVLSKPVRAREAAALEDLLRRRIDEHIPTAYLTHEAWLGGESFYVDERVIIPRSYFVEIIPRLAEILSAKPMVRGGRRPPGAGNLTRLADVGTGSACLAILLARHFPKAEVDAIDIDPGALQVARMNVSARRLGRRVRLWQSDVFDAVPLRRYDAIISNPPYEPTARVRALPPEFHREPSGALDGGGDGLKVIRKLVRQAADRLVPGGALLIEVGGLRRAIAREFSGLRPEWIATEDGSNCVCLLRY